MLGKFLLVEIQRIIGKSKSEELKTEITIHLFFISRSARGSIRERHQVKTFSEVKTPESISFYNIFD